jgi:hypothetical protein
MTGVTNSCTVPLNLAKCLFKNAEKIVLRELYSGNGMAAIQNHLWRRGSTKNEPAVGFMEEMYMVFLMSLRAHFVPRSYQCS